MCHALSTSVILTGIVMMNCISKYHSGIYTGIIATSMCTIEDVSGIQWYPMVINGMSKYHSGYH